jgi:hypothetical protein
MVKAKKNLQLISTDASSSLQKEDLPSQSTQASLEISEAQKQQISRPFRTSDNLRELKKGKAFNKDHLTNKLNYTNFQEGTILLHFKHAKYNRKIILHAKPQPCRGDRLDCLWTESDGVEQKLKSYKFESLYVTDGQNLLLVEPELIDASDKGISFNLPDTCYEVSTRKVTRHTCENVKVQLIQSSSPFYGTLLDFNTYSLHINLKAIPPQTFKWINPESGVTLIISDGDDTVYTGECKITDDTVYTGECKITKQSRGQKIREYLVEPQKNHIQRFKHREYRSIRQKITPSPDIIFKHPFTQRLVSLKVFDISGSGFSVEEAERDAVLLPGLIIPELELSVANILKVKCRAQVLYRKTYKDAQNENRVQCGLTLLDMDVQHHLNLISFLHQVENKNSYVCNKLDLDTLWRFFFETGFMYPEKYASIESNKDQIKETYKKLYLHSPNIARHFTYQENGRILGHLAMLRFYENSWLIHHHAARKPALNRAGLIVLNQIGNFSYDSHRLQSLHMDFLMCYYRPENKFPSRVFQGAARQIGNPKYCSVDKFAYFHHRHYVNHKLNMAGPWELSDTQPEDLIELENFYEHNSGGLMLNALDIEAEKLNEDDLSKEYHRLGFERKKHFYSLKKRGNLKAVSMVMVSDIGLNLSSLTNCIKVFFLDPNDITRDTLDCMISIIFNNVGRQEMPVLVFPA